VEENQTNHVDSIEGISARTNTTNLYRTNIGVFKALLCFYN